MKPRLKFAAITTAVVGLWASLAPIAACCAEPLVRRGEVRFEPNAREQALVPEPFRLEGRQFRFEEVPQSSVSDEISVSLLTFPSPVKTPEANNNTVHCEYYRPTSEGKHPACVVLHIMGGDFPLARTFADALAHRGVSALFLIMPYYGPRRQPDSNARMVSSDPRSTVRGMTQAVKDIRYAAAWLATQPEVDADQLGVFGISLGGITAALAGTAEPRFQKICPALAGGGIANVLWDSPEPHMIAARRGWEAKGGTRESLLKLMKSVDPVTYGDRIAGRKVLMLNANRDEIIPRKCTEDLWQSFGRPKIVWYDCGHYSAAWHIVDAIAQVTDFFQPDGKAKARE